MMNAGTIEMVRRGRRARGGGGVRTLAVLCALALSARGDAVRAQAAPRTHVLRAGPHTVAFGRYDASTPPVLRVASGDIVDVTTMLTNSPAGLERMGLAPARVQKELRAIYDSVTDRGPGGHILTGPIYVDGAEPGDVLEVRIIGVDLDIDYGYNGCSGFVRALCEQQSRSRIIELDRKAMKAEIAPGVTVNLHPFFGSIGVAPPPDSGRLSSNPPGRHAGNMDNKELVTGTTLYIPVHAKGALLEVGDGHAVQGDGEVDQTALETSLRGRLQLFLRKGTTLEWPRAETPTHMIAMGFDRDLAKATEIAIREAVKILQEQAGLAQGIAYSVVSMACDVRITELVDGNVGVHVMVPKTLLTNRR
jgi:acetamidase/formamidase